MDFEDNSNEDNYFREDHDSDVEARLYAEIHYTNTIIGEGSNSTDYGINKQHSKDAQTIEDNALSISSEQNINKHVDQQSKINNMLDNGRSEVSHPQTEVSTKEPTMHPVECTNFSDNVTKTPKSKKRLSVNDNNHELNTSKRKKYTPVSEKNSVGTTENASDVLTSKSNTSTTQQKNKNTIINPYNKNVVDNQKQGMGLLSFVQLFFGKKNKVKSSKLTEKKKKCTNNKLRQKNNATEVLNKNDRTCNSSANISKLAIQLQQNNTTEKQINNQAHQSTKTHINQVEVEQNNSSNSEKIINISSDSSQDSDIVKDNSKYNMAVATDKKLANKDSTLKNIDSEDSASDSEDSIFEVPVPPKPAPPMIELNDTDNENNSDSDSSSDCENSISLNNSSSFQTNVTQNERDKSVVNAFNSTSNVDNTDIISDESCNLILNCTEIQKGASSLSEIRKMNQASTAKESIKNSNNSTNNLITQKNNIRNTNVSNIENSLNRDKFNDTINNEKVNSSTKIAKKSKVDKQKRRSNVNRANVPIEEYFFQPMNDKMKSFYNDSWGGENFDIDKIKNEMSNDPNKWAILDDDLLPNFSQRRRYFGAVSNRQKDGYRNMQCSEPYKKPICYMCGVVGHLETSCPETKCLTCGRYKSRYVKTCKYCTKLLCLRCKSVGHKEKYCPDLWRRYHNTINNVNPNIPKNLKEIMKPRREQFCCNCTERGHNSFHCKRFYWSEHFPNPPYVIDYHGITYSVEDNDSSRNLNQSQEHSFDQNTTYDTTSDVSSNLNTTNKSISNLNRNTSDIKDNPSKIIFDIKSKVDMTTTKLQTETYKLKQNLDENDMYKYESWRYLSEFLTTISLRLPASFALDYNSNKRIYYMTITGTRENNKLFKSLIQQYASRSAYERSRMFLPHDKNRQRIIDHTSYKMKELMDVNEDPLQLHKEINELIIDPRNSNNESINDSQNSSDRIALKQQKLMMALHREGCADKSLATIRHIIKHVDRKIKTKMTKKSKRMQDPANAPLSTKNLIKYLFCYNNIFVPYQHPDINNLIKKYEQLVQRRNKLMNNPLLFPQNQNVTITHTTQNNINSVYSSGNSSLPSTSTMITSQIPPLISINTSIENNFHFSQEPSYNTTNISQNYVFSTRSDTTQKQNPSDQLHSHQANESKNLMSEINNSRLEKVMFKRKKNGQMEHKFKSLTEETMKLIDEAYELNAPHLKRHTEILKNKIKNQIFIYKKDIIPLKKLITEEIQRRQNYSR